MIDGQFNLHATHFVSENDFYHNCLHYKLTDYIYMYERTKDFLSPYQIIKYCIRPFEHLDEPIEERTEGNILVKYTFEHLRQLNITAGVLLSWSAPIDVVEEYQIYVDILDVSLQSEVFYKCKSPWFGLFCQYTFDSDLILNDIVQKTFEAKQYDRSPTEIDFAFINITNLTCYVHLECNRGPAPVCLDWREICNGQTDCIGSEIDEANCFELEMNQCASNEYQCHNGMCVPEEFFRDGRVDSECLDSTDEIYDRRDNKALVGFSDCYLDPSFRCEDAFHPHRDLDFTCGDGEQNSLQLFAPDHTFGTVLFGCRNGRDMMLRYLLLLDTEKTNLTAECWLLMSCLSYAGEARMCKNVCNGSSCNLRIQSKCNFSSYVIFPVIPVSPSHVHSGYFAGETIRYPINMNIEKSPHFYCYDVRLCPFFSPTFKINSHTCINHSDISLDGSNNPVRLFDRCLTVDKSVNETDCVHPSLFHCPGTSKCISKRRLLDGIVDCYGGADETYVDSCQLNDKHRFRCTSANRCISNILVQDGIEHCSQGEDEMAPHEVTLYYLNLCNGYTHMAATLVDGQNETDETNCEEWPCGNQYTRCDGAWSCRNGADEINCDRSSKCNPDHHECVSPTAFEVMCLPVNRSGDGKIDCLGGTDERPYCLSLPSYRTLDHYRCWNETRCVIPDCSEVMNCLFEKNTVFYDKCIGNGNIENLLFFVTEDEKLRNSEAFATNPFFKFKYFKLPNSNPTRTSRVNEDIFDRPILPLVTSDVFTSSNNIIDFRRAWLCNRGLVIYMGMEKNEYCLCPPAYYGNRCQLQNQRVSLIMKFSKECLPNCFGIYSIVVILVDQKRTSHSYEQFTLLTTENCDTKYNLNLLYQSRPKDQTINYSIHVHAYDKQDLSYYASWILPVRFLLLPINRMAARLIIPSHGNHIVDQCPLQCGDHGHCNIFVNSEQSFCRCDSGWSGQHCEVHNTDCSCSPDSVCLGTVNKRSICVCSLSKFGPRCFLRLICQNDTCKNGGRCLLADDQWSFNKYTCICKPGFSGYRCERQDTRIDFSFNHMEIPQSLSVYFVTVQRDSDPLITIFSKKIPFDQDKTAIFAPLLFNLIFARIRNAYYLVYNDVKASYLPHLSIAIRSSHRCLSVDELLEKRTLSFTLLRRAKYYHVACRERPSLACLYDLEGFICLCDQERFANCLHFDLSSKSRCQQRSLCENDGECFPDRAFCPNAMMCVCNKCYFGAKCQLTTKGFGLSLDTILGYQVQQHESIARQKAAVKMSVAITTFMFCLGLISGTLATMTFNSKNLLEVGCGFYLRTLSILSIVSATILTLKLWLLIATQSLWITNRVILWINCISIEFILRSQPAIGDWLSACVATERIFVFVKGVTFNKDKSKQIARWIIIGVILLTIVSVIHDPIHRRLIDDEGEKRTWCVVRYSSVLQILDSAVHIFHFIIPFAINFISSIVIIINIARTQSNVRKNQSYGQHLRKQFRDKKHLILSPIILVLLAVPRLIISFLSGCMESVRDPWLFLFGYFVSFLPSLMMPIIFIVPSEIYRKEFFVVLRTMRETIRYCLHLNRSN